MRIRSLAARCPNCCSIETIEHAPLNYPTSLLGPSFSEAHPRKTGVSSNSSTPLEQSFLKIPAKQATQFPQGHQSSSTLVTFRPGPYISRDVWRPPMLHQASSRTKSFSFNHSRGRRKLWWFFERMSWRQWREVRTKGRQHIFHPHNRHYPRYLHHFFPPLHASCNDSYKAPVSLWRSQKEGYA